MGWRIEMPDIRPIETAPREDYVRVRLWTRPPDEPEAPLRWVVGYWRDASGKPGDWYTPAGWYSKEFQDEEYRFDYRPLEPEGWQDYLGPPEEHVFRRRGWATPGERFFRSGGAMHTDYYATWDSASFTDAPAFFSLGSPKDWYLSSDRLKPPLEQ
jgi:hypothetical protein